MKNKKYNVIEVSRITGIPSTTIRHLIRTNVISVEKDPENGYHMFDNDDIWVLFDFLRSRDRGFTLSTYNKERTLSDLEKIYLNALTKIDEKRKKLNAQFDDVSLMLSRLKEIAMLEEVPFVRQSPEPICKIVKRDFTNPALQHLFSTTAANIAAYVEINDDLSIVKHGGVIVPADFEDKNVLWTLPQKATFYATLIKRKMSENEDDTFNVLKKLKNAGLVPQHMIVISLGSDTKNDLDYFKAFVCVNS